MVYQNEAVDIVSISSSSMLVDLSIRSWTGTKIDRDTTQMIDTVNSTTTNAGKYQKNLFAGTKDLHDINKFDSRIRAWNISQTLPWSDKGQRLLPSSKFFEYKQALSNYEAMRKDMINKFLEKYDDLINEAEQALGGLFKRDDYPDKAQVARQFEFKYSFLPVPVDGDFRVDIGNEAIDELKLQFNSSVNERVNNAMADVMWRLEDCLKRMSERLADDDSGAISKKKIFRDTLVTNAQELCEDLKHLNITNNPQIENARKQLSKAVHDIDAESLRDSAFHRQEVKAQVDDILSKFNW
jgi:hypothetical protein